MDPAPLNLRDLSDTSFSYDTSSDLFLFTSLTAGSSHIITATSRLETILKANRVAFQAVDVATDEKARRLWGRRAGKRKLPGLVKEGEVVADLEQVEEWNEYGEIKDNLGGGGRAPIFKQARAAAVQPAQSSPAPSISSVATSATANKSVEAPAQQLDNKSSVGSIQSLQQAQQAALASQVAAAANARKAQKLKPAATPEPTPTPDPITAAEAAPAPNTITTASETPETAPPPTTDDIVTAEPADLTENIRPAASPPLRSPEGDPDFDISDPNPKHNTSQHTGLTPLVLRPKYPDQEPVEPISTSSVVTEEVREPVGAVKGEAEDESQAIDGAAPASKSGLEAVTNDPEAMAASMNARPEVAEIEKRRSTNISPASAQEIAEVESRDAIQEDPDEDLEAVPVPAPLKLSSSKPSSPRSPSGAFSAFPNTSTMTPTKQREGRIPVPRSATQTPEKLRNRGARVLEGAGDERDDVEAEKPGVTGAAGEDGGAAAGTGPDGDKERENQPQHVTFDDDEPKTDAGVGEKAGESVLD